MRRRNSLTIRKRFPSAPTWAMPAGAKSTVRRYFASSSRSRASLALSACSASIRSVTNSEKMMMPPISPEGWCHGRMSQRTHSVRPSGRSRGSASDRSEAPARQRRWTSRQRSGISGSSSVMAAADHVLSSKAIIRLPALAGRDIAHLGIEDRDPGWRDALDRGPEFQDLRFLVFHRRGLGRKSANLRQSPPRRVRGVGCRFFIRRFEAHRGLAWVDWRSRPGEVRGPGAPSRYARGHPGGGD